MIDHTVVNVALIDVVEPFNW